MEDITQTREQLSIISKRLEAVKMDLRVEKVLYANMKEILKKREEEIDNLYNIINELISG